ncbi:MAG: undecaprenyl phosphate translocase family protein [Ruthenibacterium lactatiformans]
MRACALGIILTTKLLERAMEKHPQQTYLLILGFVLGSLPELFPGFPVSVPQWLMCLFSLALGGGAIWLLSSQEA